MSPTKLLLAATLLASFGCNSVGPRAVHTARQPYNEAMAMARDQEVLWNLLRIAEGRKPHFLKVDTLTTRYKFNASASVGISPTDTLALTNSSKATGTNDPELTTTRVDTDVKAPSASVGGAWEEHPTVIYEPLDGRDFSKRLLTPVSLENLALLFEAGFDGKLLVDLFVSRAGEFYETSDKDLDPLEKFGETIAALQRAHYLQFMAVAGEPVGGGRTTPSKVFMALRNFTDPKNNPKEVCKFLCMLPAPEPGPTKKLVEELHSDERLDLRLRERLLNKLERTAERIAEEILQEADKKVDKRVDKGSDAKPSEKPDQEVHKRLVEELLGELTSEEKSAEQCSGHFDYWCSNHKTLSDTTEKECSDKDKQPKVNTTLLPFHNGSSPDGKTQPPLIATRSLTRAIRRAIDEETFGEPLDLVTRFCRKADQTSVRAEGILNLRCSPHRPSNSKADVAARYRGKWFWIPTNDASPNSKQAYLLFSLVYTMQAEEPALNRSPELVIPVG